MSYNNIISNKDNKLSICWTAGANKNGLTKLFKRHEIESVNVPETCDKIRTAITEQFRNQSVTSNNLDCQESVVFPFRIATNLCFGTLRLYQQQVQNLFERTRNFFAYSSFQVREINAIKRRSSLQSQNASKKRRIDNSKNSYTNDFSELLHDSEDIQNWTQNKFESMTEVNSTSVENQFINCLQSTRLQIREITIREVNIDYNIPGIDDCAFGNATAEELQEFYNTFGDEESISCLPKAKTNKRKLPMEYQDLDRDVIPKNSKISNVADKTLNEDCDLSSIYNCAEGFELQNNSIENLNSSSILVSTQVSKHLHDSDVNIALADTSVKSHLDLENHVSAERNSFPITMPKSKNQSINIILDKLTKLPKEEYYLQFKHYKEKECMKLDHIKELPRTNFEDLCKLLPTPSRKCILSCSHKKKIKSYFNNNYTEQIDILNDIFGCSVDNNLVAEICTISSSRNRRKRNRADQNLNLNEEIYPLLQTEINNNNDNIFDNNNMCVKRKRLSNRQENFLLKSGNKNETEEECGPYSVMMRILDITRSYPNAIIKAKTFLRNIPTNRKQAALTFYSLLDLAKQKLIVITKKENSCEMDEIDLGPASASLIQNIGVQ